MISDKLDLVKEELNDGVKLVAVSKYHPSEMILDAYNAGQLIFGESHVQELLSKYDTLPKDIEWHFIGHLQTNKVKYIVPFVSLIHSVDTEKLLREIDKQASKIDRVVDCLLQVHIAKEETKFGFTADELVEFLSKGDLKQYGHVRVVGLMTMATNTDDQEQVSDEFAYAHDLFLQIKNDFFHEDESFKELSMGMSGDYKIALQNGTTMVRVGSLIFGDRQY